MRPKMQHPSPAEPLSRRWLLGAIAGLGIGVDSTLHAAETRSQELKLDMRLQSGHPRLYFTATELPGLRAQRKSGVPARIWRNLQRSAEECLSREPRQAWIAPVTPDPVYENLYDRFYAIMGDLAITEHLAFAAALGEEERFAVAARRWLLASCRAWQREADGEPDGGKAYAVTRLLKGVAVGYDCVYGRMTTGERDEIRDVLTRIGRRYFEGYFSTPTIAGPGFHTHHAIVEWSSFGVLALALLGEVPDADAWLAATVRKFETHLLPTGLAPDGAQTEGSTFWASTLQYRLFFMDALRRVTGRDLYQPFAATMNADLALAAVAGEHRPEHWIEHGSVVLEPGYGQLDYYAPVLLALAREYHHPTLRRLALWDRTLGSLQKTRYVTPKGEQLLFCLGPYAYLWCEPSAAQQPGEEKLSYAFPSVGEAYARASWEPGDLLVGVRKDQVVIHAGGEAVLVAGGNETTSTHEIRPELSDDGRLAVIRVRLGGQETLVIELDRQAHRVHLRRRNPGEWTVWCHSRPEEAKDGLRWKAGGRLIVEAGRIARMQPDGYAPIMAVGNGKLLLADPAPRRFPQITLAPGTGGELSLEVRRTR